MLEVVGLEEARTLVLESFHAIEREETVSLREACGRVLARNIVAEEGIPPFDRSTMDGYAVRASDTFGCSESIPALLTVVEEIPMGATPKVRCGASECSRIATGGMLPEGADAVVMIEHTESYGDGTVGIYKSVSPGENLVLKNDELSCGETLISKGTKIAPHHIGTMASLGISEVVVKARPRVGIVSTGDEIVDFTQTPHDAQMRDVNGPMLAAAVTACGAEPYFVGIIPDERDILRDCIGKAKDEFDMVLTSGGSSAGERDNTAAVFSEFGDLLFHGVAIKPGKPTICANLSGVPAFGLPGHPAAAYFVFLELVKPVIDRLSGVAKNSLNAAVDATVLEAVPSNHGRSECLPIVLSDDVDRGRIANVKHSKSGLISRFLGCDGYIVVPRESEGLPAKAPVRVNPLLSK